MAKAVHQFRFYKDSANEERNEPSADEFTAVGGASGFANGDVFKDYYPFYQLGIQTIPGTAIYLNGSEDPVIIGSTGIYELDMADGVEVFTLQINSASLAQIGSSADGYIIIDVLYDDRKGVSV